MLCGVEIMLQEAKKIEEHVHNRKIPLENIRDNARKFYHQCATNFTRLQSCEESGSYSIEEVHENADQLASSCVTLYDLTHGEVIPDRFDSFSRGILNIDSDFKMCVLQYFEGFIGSSTEIPDDTKIYEWDLRRNKDPISIAIEPLTRYLITRKPTCSTLSVLDELDSWKEVEEFDDGLTYWKARDSVLKHVQENKKMYVSLARSPRK